MANKDPLKNVMGNVNKQIHDNDAPFKKNREPTRSVQIRLSIFKKLRIRAFKENTTMVNLVGKALKYAFDHNII